MSLLHTFLSFVMRNRPNAWFIAGGSAFLASFFPFPFLWLAGGLLVLVTLVQGLREGLIVLGILLFMTWLGAQVLNHDISFPLGNLVVIWVLACVLRVSQSQWFLLLVAMLIAIVLIVIPYLFVDDITVWKRDVVWQILGQGGQGQDPLAELERNSQFSNVSAQPEFIGSVVFIFMLVFALGSNYIGRWWQAILYNPGAFRREFCKLRVPYALAIPAMLTLLGSLYFTGIWAELFLNISLPILAVYWIGGLALLHCVGGQFHVHRAFIIIFYVLNFIPHVLLLTAGTGFLDSLFNFRNYINKNRN